MPGARDFNEEDLANLSAEERAQLEELERDEQEALAAIAAEGGDAGAEGDDDQIADEATAAAAEASAASAPAPAPAAAAPAPAGAPAAAEDGAVPAAPAPIYVSNVETAEANKQLDTLRVHRRELRKQWQDGQITDEDYDTKLDANEAESDRIKSSLTRAQVAADITAQQLANSYQVTVDTFLNDITKAGFNYRDPKNAQALAHLDRNIKALAATCAEDTPEEWRRVMNDAHSLTANRFKIQTAAAPAPAPSPAPAPAPRKPDLSKVHPTISQGPAAAAPAVGGGEFAHLDGLTGLDLERAIAKMTPEQLDRWESA
ncbi:MAG: hypothetical protein QM762_08810 [Chryseolinea sp.]